MAVSLISAFLSSLLSTLWTPAPAVSCHSQMWKSVVGHDVSVSVETQGDDWDTDPDFVVSLEVALLGQ